MTLHQCCLSSPRGSESINDEVVILRNQKDMEQTWTSEGNDGLRAYHETGAGLVKFSGRGEMTGWGKKAIKA